MAVIERVGEVVASSGDGSVVAERRSFESFFRSEQDGLLRFCWGLTLDRDTARDIAQESMVRALAGWDGLADGNPAGWVRTVALNLVRTQWRSGQRREVALGRLGRTEPPPDEGPGAVTHDVVVALRSLSDRQREALVLHHMADFPVADVAQVMGIGVPAVKTHLQRGRAALAGLLGDVGGER